MTDTPNQPKLPEGTLACSLSGTDQADRALWLERLSEQALAVLTRPDGVSVAFAASDSTEAEVRALAEAEARCCPFLTLEVKRQPNRIELVVTGPPLALPMIETMFETRR